MTPFTSPLFWCLILSASAGIVFGSALFVVWRAPDWLSE